MSSHNSVAKSVRERKEKYPQYYCRVYNCLWNTSGRVNGELTLDVNPCRNHPKPTTECLRHGNVNCFICEVSAWGLAVNERR
jgi:hypothetical protein